MKIGFEIMTLAMFLTGKRYIVNLKSKEIHRIYSRNPQCNLAIISKKKYISVRQLPVWLRSEYNGCRFCLPEYDTDMNDLKIFVV